MEVLQGMDPDKMVIIFPTALVAMYLIIRLQKTLCERSNPNIGLILPVLCFIVATVLAVRPLLIADSGEYDGLMTFCLRMWLTFNIATIVFLFPYLKQRKYTRALRAAEAAEASRTAETGEAEQNAEAVEQIEENPKSE